MTSFVLRSPVRPSPCSLESDVVVPQVELEEEMTPRTRRPTAVRALPGILLLALTAVVLATACGTRNEGERREVFRRVSAPVAFEMMHDFPELPVLDLRPTEDFHGPLGHIQGALSVPRRALPDRLREISYLRDDTFLIYCHSDECAPETLDYLREQGFDNAMLIDGGIEGWVEAGFGTVGAEAGGEHVHETVDGGRRPD